MLILTYLWVFHLFHIHSKRFWSRNPKRPIADRAYISFVMLYIAQQNWVVSLCYWALAMLMGTLKAWLKGISKAAA